MCLTQTNISIIDLVGINFFSSFVYIKCTLYTVYTLTVHAYVTNEQLIAQFICLCVFYIWYEREMDRSKDREIERERTLSKDPSIHVFVNTEPRFTWLFCARAGNEMKYTERTGETKKVRSRNT